MAKGKQRKKLWFLIILDWSISPFRSDAVGRPLFCAFNRRFETNFSISKGILIRIFWKTLPKAQRTRGLSSAYQSNFFRSYHKFLHKSWSNIFRISTKHQLQNLNQASAFWRNLNLKLLTKPIFRILTKIELHNHMKHQQQNNDQTSASKSCLNINFKILTKLWSLVLKGWTKNLTLWPNHLPNLHQNVVNMFLIVNSNNPNNFWVVIFRGQSHINQVYSIGVSQSVI